MPKTHREMSCHLCCHAISYKDARIAKQRMDTSQQEIESQGPWQSEPGSRREGVGRQDQRSDTGQLKDKGSGQNPSNGSIVWSAHGRYQIAQGSNGAIGLGIEAAKVGVRMQVLGFYNSLGLLAKVRFP